MKAAGEVLAENLDVIASLLVPRLSVVVSLLAPSELASGMRPGYERVDFNRMVPLSSGMRTPVNPFLKGQK